MKVLGIVGSPHKDGLNNRLVQKVLAGARNMGADGTEDMYLADYTIDSCRGCRGATCWENGRCTHDVHAAERNEKIAEADALVFSAPVYILDICGLAKDFIDKVRVVPRGGRYGPYQPSNGKPALAITVAGSTGKGVLTSLQAIYYGLFFLCGYRVLDPLTVTRFNLEDCLTQAEVRGGELVEAASERRPFEKEGLGDRMAYYSKLPWAKADPVDDNFYLLRVLLDCLRGAHPPDVLRSIETCYAEAIELMTNGRHTDAATPIWQGYLEAIALWEARQTP